MFTVKFGRHVLNSINIIRNSNSVLKSLYSTPTYESSISLRSLYPTSSLLLSTPTKLPESEGGKFTGYVPMDKIKITFSRSSGAGGQNVNKVSTKVDLRFHVETADWLSKDTRAKLLEQVKNLISNDGFLIIKSQKTRSQSLNIADALDKLRVLVRKAEEEPATPSPESIELARKRKARANQKRLNDKRMRSKLKADRRMSY